MSQGLSSTREFVLGYSQISVNNCPGSWHLILLCNHCTFSFFSPMDMYIHKSAQVCLRLEFCFSKLLLKGDLKGIKPHNQQNQQQCWNTGDQQCWSGMLVDQILKVGRWNFVSSSPLGASVSKMTLRQMFA